MSPLEFEATGNCAGWCFAFWSVFGYRDILQRYSIDGFPVPFQFSDDVIAYKCRTCACCCHEYFLTNVGTSFPSVAIYASSIFPFVAAESVATTATCLAGAVITWKTLSRSGTETSSSTIPRWPVKLVGELVFYTTGEPVLMYQDKCIMKFQPDSFFCYSCERCYHFLQPFGGPSSFSRRCPVQA